MLGSFLLVGALTRARHLLAEPECKDFVSPIGSVLNRISPGILDMVTVGSKADLGNDTVSLNTQSANRKIHSWAPRTGRSQGFNLWVLQYVLDEYDYSSLRDFMHDEPPNLESAKAMDKASGTNTGEKVYPQALQDFQTINTAVFNFVKDTLILEGEFLLDDMATIRSYVSGRLKDGQGLLKWCFSFIDDSSLDAQETISRLLETTKLSQNANSTQLKRHLQLLFELWCRKSGNDPNVNGQFWIRALSSIPSDPPNAHLTTART